MYFLGTLIFILKYQVNFYLFFFIDFLDFFEFPCFFDLIFFFLFRLSSELLESVEVTSLAVSLEAESDSEEEVDESSLDV